MKNKLIIISYYEVLNLNVNSDWNNCKKKYRQSVNIWHPDKFNSDQGNKLIADEKIKEINIAYTFISEYYRQNKIMPGKLIQNMDDNRRDEFDVSSLYEQINSKQINSQSFSYFTKKKHLFIAFLTIILAIIYFQPENTTQTINNINSDSISSKPLVSSENIVQFIIKGSSIENVLEIHGTPTQLIGEKWYYGNSWIKFENGYVINWSDDKGYPLNIKKKADIQFNLFELKKSSYKISIGSTKQNVLEIQGKPIRETDNIWYYEISKIYFENNKVVSWFNSPLDQLLVNE